MSSKVKGCESVVPDCELFGGCDSVNSVLTSVIPQVRLLLTYLDAMLVAGSPLGHSAQRCVSLVHWPLLCLSIILRFVFKT